eukprot:Amastigsp_a176607_61.p6 type:complete len:107 gc:universal Amastigsp_a176607_61:1425-1745(+)
MRYFSFGEKSIVTTFGCSKRRMQTLRSEPQSSTAPAKSAAKSVKTARYEPRGDHSTSGYPRYMRAAEGRDHPWRSNTVCGACIESFHLTEIVSPYLMRNWSRPSPS